VDFQKSCNLAENFRKAMKETLKNLSKPSEDSLFLSKEYREEETLLRYVFEVANHFLPSYNPPEYDYDEETGEELYREGYYTRSLYPDQFVKRFFNGKVKIDDDRQNDYLNKDDLIKCVKYYGLDVSAFWYLCLFIGDYVNGFSTEHTKSLSTSSLIEIFKLKEGFSKIGITHDETLGNVKMKNSAELSLKIEGKRGQISVKDPKCLALLKLIIDETLKFDNIPSSFMHVNLNYFKPYSMPQTHKLYIFHKYLSWFLKEKEKDPNCKERPWNTSKDFLISQMAYIAGVVDDRNRYFEGSLNSKNDKNRISDILRKINDIVVGENTKMNGHYKTL
jgi:hypothetical protein